MQGRGGPPQRCEAGVGHVNQVVGAVVCVECLEFAVKWWAVQQQQQLPEIFHITLDFVSRSVAPPSRRVAVSRGVAGCCGLSRAGRRLSRRRRGRTGRGLSRRGVAGSVAPPSRAGRHAPGRATVAVCVAGCRGCRGPSFFCQNRDMCTVSVIRTAGFSSQHSIFLIQTYILPQNTTLYLYTLKSPTYVMTRTYTLTFRSLLYQRMAMGVWHRID